MRVTTGARSLLLNKSASRSTVGSCAIGSLRAELWRVFRLSVADSVIAQVVGNSSLSRIHRNVSLVTVCLGLAAGCSSNVTLEQTTIPTPLTTKIPASIGLRMPANFDKFVHEEQVYGRDVWSIDLGDANANLFRQLFGHMFYRVTLLDEDDDPGLMNLDALIEPSIDAFEFSVPAQSKTEAFAVWVRYRLKIYDRDGNLVSNWPVSAYGKSGTAALGNSEALQRAAVLAMRDAAALIIMKLDSATGISALVRETDPAAAPTAAPDVLEESDDHDVQTRAVEGIADEAG